MKPLFKTVIVIWSEYDPDVEGMEIDALACEAMNGNAYCSRAATELVVNPEDNEDWDETEFFDEDDS